MVLAYGVGRIMMVALAQLRDAVFARVSQRAVRELAGRTFRHLHALSLKFHLERRTGGLSRLRCPGAQAIEPGGPGGTDRVQQRARRSRVRVVRRVEHLLRRDEVEEAEQVDRAPDRGIEEDSRLARETAGQPGEVGDSRVRDDQLHLRVLADEPCEVIGDRRQATPAVNEDRHASLRRQCEDWLEPLVEVDSPRWGKFAMQNSFPKLSDTPYDDAMAMPRGIAGRSPDAVRAGKALLNGLFNQGAAEQFAAERHHIGSLIGRPNQMEAVMSNFEQRPANFVDPG